MEKSEKVALIAILVNLTVFAIKYVTASLSGSIALKAEAFHTFADLIASLTLFAGLKIAKRKTRSFPYGLYKLENLLSVCISLVIFYTGYEIVMEAMGGTSTDLRNSGAAISGLIVSVAITFLFSRYERKVGLEISSPILLADSGHIRTDVMSNIVVLAAVISSLWGVHADKVAALVVVIFIARAGVLILVDGARVLLDASVDYETLSRVEKIIAGTPQVVELKSLKGRNSGRFKFIEASIVIKTHNLDRAHFIAERIERQTKNEIMNIDQVLIQYEPLQKAEVTYALPLSVDRATISHHFGEAPFFMIATFKAEYKDAVEVDIVSNPYSHEEKGKGILAAEFLVDYGVDFVIVKSDFSSKGPSYVFSSANVDIIPTAENTPEDALGSMGLSFESKK
jgi:cation diffusion facilitator family transporter